MTEREAIRECKRKYRAYIKAGDCSLSLVPNELALRMIKYLHECPLCEYVRQKTDKTPYTDIRDACTLCPLVIQYHMTCVELRYKLDWRIFAKYVFALRGDR